MINDRVLNDIRSKEVSDFREDFNSKTVQDALVLRKMFMNEHDAGGDEVYRNHAKEMMAHYNKIIRDALAL